MVAEITVLSWVELSIAMMTVTAHSGSAGTVLVEFSCAVRMVSCGVAQELAVVGDFAVMVMCSWWLLLVAGLVAEILGVVVVVSREM